MALLLPRVNLFIAADVGLGKTIETGLIVRELMLRQRVERIVVTPLPSVVPQWREELDDREYVHQKRVERGHGVNPWTTHSRFIISHALLRDPSDAIGLQGWMYNSNKPLADSQPLGEGANAGSSRVSVFTMACCRRERSEGPALPP
ncbi:MAG: helicase domain protein [Gemmatimonadetes bacterium]|nr:helicase domain protein [Gemmatimonadota bacterium]